MMAVVEAQTYAPHPDPQQHDTLLADNPAQRLTVRFARSAVSFTTAEPDTARAQSASGKRLSAPQRAREAARAAATGPSQATRSEATTFHLRTRIGGLTAPCVAPVAAGNRVEYRHAGYIEWYVNDAKGVEQGWTLDGPTRGGKAPRIRIEVGGARTIAEGADAVRIEDRNGTLRYRYAGLKAWDADHRAIPATLHLARSGRIDIAVDDRGARYPISVDPTLTVTQEIALSQSAAGFGNAVAVDGDTVVVGAPNVNSNLGQAFIFSRNQGGADAWGLVATLNDPASMANDLFGSSVAVNGDTVVVALKSLRSANNNASIYIYERNLGGASAWGLAYSYNSGTSGGADSAAVYGNRAVALVGGSVVIFDRNTDGAGTWDFTTTLSDPNLSAGDCYGCAVALNGSTVVVGAYNAGTSGQAYVYSLSPGSFNNWTLSATLSEPAAAAGDSFGTSVAVNGDTIVVGAEFANKAYVFTRNQNGIAGSWGLVKTLADPAATADDYFGFAVAVDGDFVVVGSTLVNSSHGAAYVFARNQGGAGAWGLAATLNNPTDTASLFGEILALSGDTLIVGLPDNGSAYIYDLSGGTSSTEAAIADPSASANDDFGYAVAVNGDTAVVGASGVASSQGRAFIFERNQGGAGAWGIAATLGDPAATAYDYFGYAVSVDGDTVAVGAYGTNHSAGAVYVYGRNQNGLGAWGLVQSLSGATGAEFGDAVAVNGSTLAVGMGLSAGPAVQIWELNKGGHWQLFVSVADPLATAGSNDWFGSAVAVYGDTLIVGAYGSNSFQGAATLYNRNQGGAENWGKVVTITDPAATTGDGFGSSVAVNGATAVVGAPDYKSATGRAYVYGNQSSGWGIIATLEDPATAIGDNFGAAVAVSGDTVVVGSPHVFGGGAAYVFNRNQGGANAWGATLTLADPNVSASDDYGTAVAVDGESVVIGAYQFNQTKGEAYIFGIQQATAAKDASILWHNTSGQVVLWNMNGAAIASAPDLGTVPAGWSIVGTADFNGDGSPDILWRNTNGDVVVWFTNGTTVTSSLNLGIIPTTWTLAGTGDFNGNGNADILWRNSNGDTVIWFMNGSGIVSSSDLGTVATSWTIAGTGDFNDDGDTDILWRNSNGDVVIWFMDGGTISSSANLGVIASSWKVAGSGDFNGDGHGDILWRNSNGDVVIWFMNGGTISSSADLGVVPSAWSIAGTGDFNGNGKDDMLWHNSNGDTVIWFMNGGTITTSSDLGVVPTSWSVAGVGGN